MWTVPEVLPPASAIDPWSVFAALTVTRKDMCLSSHLFAVCIDNLGRPDALFAAFQAEKETCGILLVSNEGWVAEAV